MIKRTISRTKENAYYKIDVERFVRRPSFDDVKPTSFLAADSLVFFAPGKGYQMKDVDEIDINSCLDVIKQKTIAN